jgi:hypothetical protein
MSFASGFAAGSAAAQRGLDMARQRYETDLQVAEQARLEKRRQKYAGLANEADVANRMRKDNVTIPMSPVPQTETKYPPEVEEALGGLGGTPPPMSAVETPAPTPNVMGVGLGNSTQTTYQPMSTIDYYNRAANIEAEFGNPDRAIELLGSAATESRRIKRDEIEDARYREYRDYLATRDARADEEFDVTAKRLNDQMQSLIERNDALNNALNAGLLDTAEDRGVANATLAGQQAYTSAALTGASISNVMNTLPEGVTAGTPAANAYMQSVAGNYIRELGIGAQDVGRIARQVVAPVEQVLSTGYDDTPEGKIAELNAYNRVLQNVVPDPDETDNIVPQLVVNDDGKYQVLYGDRALTEPMDSPRLIAEEYVKGVKGNLGFTIDYIDAKNRNARAALSRAKTEEARRELVGELAADPFYAQNPKMMDLVLEKAGFSVGFEPGGDYNPDSSTNLRDNLEGFGNGQEPPPPPESSTPRTGISPLASATATGLSRANDAAGFVLDSLGLPIRYGGMGLEAAYNATGDFIQDTRAALRRE